MRKIAAAALLASGLVACKGAQVRPTAKHDLPGTDIQNCYRNARNIDSTLGEVEAKPIKITLFMYVDTDGAVPAAFIHDAQNSSAPLNGCLVDAATESKFDTEDTDYTRAQPMYFLKTQAMFKQLHEQPVGEFDQKLAESTLQIAPWATATDKGWAYYLVHDYPKALEQFKAAIAAKADDARAQRGLALATLASGGDVKAARAAAEAAVKANPDSVAAHEAMVRVCLAEKDDKCTLDEWERATRGEMDDKGNVTKPADEKQKQALSFEMAELVQPVKAVFDRYKETSEKERKESEEKMRAEAEKRADPTGCGKAPEGDERALCFVKYCFGDGAKAYAKELKPLTGADYTAGEWKVGKGKGGTEVTVPIRASKKNRAQPHDATWQVSIGDTVDMKPMTIDANNISTKHNACRK